MDTKEYVVFLEQNPEKSEFFTLVDAAAKKNNFELVMSETIEDAKNKMVKTNGEGGSLVAVITPILYPDLINVIKLMSQVDPFAQLVFLFAKNEENIARNVISSYMLVGVERQITSLTDDELAPILSQASKVVSQRRRQKTNLGGL